MVGNLTQLSENISTAVLSDLVKNNFGLSLLTRQPEAIWVILVWKVKVQKINCSCKWPLNDIQQIMKNKSIEKKTCLFSAMKSRLESIKVLRKF